MTSTPPPWQPPGPVPPTKAKIGRKPALIGMAAAGVVGILLGNAAKSDASGPGPTSTATVTRPVATVTRPAATVTLHSTVTKTMRVTSTKTVTAAAAQRASNPASSAAAQDCTPGYTPCIPPGPDVDCAGGSGNGPRYVQGPVYVKGDDPYGLDADHDGVGCE